MKKQIILITVALATLFSCNSEENAVPEIPDVPSNPITPDSVPQFDEPDIFSLPSQKQKKISLDSRQAQACQAVNAFSWNLLAKLYQQKTAGNLLISPYSLSQDLLMLTGGLQSETLEQVRMAMGLQELSQEDLDQYVQQMNKGLAEADPRTQYCTANALWYKNGLTPREEFASRLPLYYDASIAAADMDENTRQEINSWALRSTYGRVKELLSQLPPSTSAVLANTVYFRGQWFDQIRPEDISEGTFRNDRGEDENARMCRTGMTEEYEQGETYQSCLLPFGNRAYAINFILPAEGASPAQAISEYMRNAGEGSTAIRSGKANLMFPCFEAEAEMNLEKLLSGVGITSLFDESRMADICMFQTPSKLGTIIQKASLTVNEKGAEAGVATATVWKYDSGIDPVYHDMFLTRPFFYTIIETSTRTPLFMGYQATVK